jgi:TetR/AcrR family transcriptional repressor of nem operon
MRYDKDHKEQTRRRIVDTAARRFREHGIEAEGVKSLMSAAGLTNGAFYNHFASKEDLAREAVSAAMEERVAYLRQWMASEEGLEGMIRSYFSTRHRDNPGRGCPSTVLAAEIARHSEEVRAAYTDGVNRFVALAADHWRQLPREEALSRARALYGLMAGSMQVARAVNDAAWSEQILESGLQAALALAGATMPVPGAYLSCE